MTTLSERPAPHASVDTAFLVDQVVLFDDRNGRVYELDPSASAVWLLLDGEMSLGEVADELHELTGVEPDVLRATIDIVVTDFAGCGLLDGTEPAGDAAANGDHHDPRRPAGAAGAAGPSVLPAPPEP